MKNHKTFKKILLSLLFFSLLITLAYPVTVEAAISDPMKFQPQIGIPGLWSANEVIPLKDNNTSYIAKMIKGFYNYGIGIAGILAAIMLMAGGLVWLTSAGSAEKITQAKNLMSGSVIGLVILFGSWMLLRTINPALVDFKITDINTIDVILINSCCQYKNWTAKEGTSQTDCVNSGGEFFQKGKIITNSTHSICVDSGCCRCSIGGSWKTLWISDSTCLDKEILGNVVLPDTCANACEAAGVAQNMPSESLFVWGKVCSQSGECTFSTGGAGSEW